MHEAYSIVMGKWIFISLYYSEEETEKHNSHTFEYSKLKKVPKKVTVAHFYFFKALNNLVEHCGSYIHTEIRGSGCSRKKSGSL
jgi:5-bromo-4-chloroindolyl phosphate hydrolysis protein